MGQSICFLTATLLAAQTPQGDVIYQTQYQQRAGCDCQQGGSVSGGGGSGSPASSESFPRVRGFFRSVGQACAERPGLVNRVRDIFGGDQPQQYAKQAQPSRPSLGQPYNSQLVKNAPVVPPTAQPTTQPTAQPAAQIVSQQMPAGPSLEQTAEPELATSKPATRNAATPKVATTNFRPAVPRPLPAAPLPARKENKISPKFADKVGHEDDYSWITGQLDQEGGRWVLRYASPETVDRFGGELPFAAGASVNNLQAGDLVSATGQVIGSGNSAQYRVGSINLIERK